MNLLTPKCGGSLEDLLVFHYIIEKLQGNQLVLKHYPICMLSFKTGPVVIFFFNSCQVHFQKWSKYIPSNGKLLSPGKSWCEALHYDSWLCVIEASRPAVSQTQLYSLCVVPMGEREAGDRRPTWPSSMECFLLRDWLLAGGGVGHFRRPLVVELYGLPKKTKRADRKFRAQ